MKKKLLFALSLMVGATLFFITQRNDNEQVTSKVERKVINVSQAGKKKTPEERTLFNEARLLHEYYRQVNPLTGEISEADKLAEKQQAEAAELRINSNPNSRAPETSNIISRGPTNLGGRTRALAYDISDPTGNTILAGGVSGGMFRTTDGGATWNKVSPNDQIHNVTAIAQDPRPGFQNIWYYGTGESSGNSASLNGAFYLGQGIWQSTDGGLTWNQMPSTASNQNSFDNRFDLVHRLAVHPTTGDLYAGIVARLTYFNGATWTTLIDASAGTSSAILVDVAITATGRAYAAFSGNAGAERGVWTSANGTSGWTQIGDNTSPFNIRTASGRVVLGLAPSNTDIVYALYYNDGTTSSPGEADLFRWNQSAGTWTNFSSLIPDEPGGSAGNDPFAIQGGYDLVVAVKPDNENYVVIGGTNVYRNTNVNTNSFTRIGGYDGPSTYALWNNGGGDDHHPDIHALVFNPFNPNQMLSGTDGGVHLSNNINTDPHPWVNLNNNYVTYQYYHVAMDPQSGSDIVIGGAQDNGTTQGGTGVGQPDLTTMSSTFGGDGVAVAISRDNACIPFYFGSQGGQIIRDCPTGAVITPTGSSSQFVTYFYLDPDNNNALYYAGQNTLYRTTNATTVTSGTWTNMGTTASQGDNDYFQTFSTTRGAYNAATSYMLLGGDEGHIYRLDDPQNAASFASAVDITPPGATLAFPSIVTGLAIHPTNRDIVLATYSNYGTQSIFLTTNATSGAPTWTLVERNLSEHSIRSAAIAEVAGETLYIVGTARGLYSSTDPTTTDWVREGPNTIGFAVVSSLVYRPSDNKLLIGTHGNGMFEATIQDSTLSIDDKEDISDQLVVYPNPATDNININLPNITNEIIGYNIKNILGQRVLQGTLGNNGIIDIKSLQSGNYFIEVTINGRKGIKQFIKN